MNIGYAVMTCQRDNDYFTETMQSIEDADIPYPHVISDGEFIHHFHRDSYHALCRLGIKPTFKLALQFLSRRYSGWCVIFQDDIQVAHGLGEWLPNNLIDGAICSLYCSSVHDDQSITGWKHLDMTPRPEEQFPWMRSLGACAIAMPRDVALLFLEEDPQFNRNDRLGAALGEFAFRERIPFYVHCPSLVQHVGAVSVTRGMPLSKERQAARFCEDVEELI